ncbi:hypothetical protein PM082_015182 [Marasmius tenuissimus]|nr:hypothetical protein PM082_015182 [Marasmius tenuissimus]
MGVNKKDIINERSPENDRLPAFDVFTRFNSDTLLVILTPPPACTIHLATPLRQRPVFQPPKATCSHLVMSRYVTSRQEWPLVIMCKRNQWQIPQGKKKLTSRVVKFSGPRSHQLRVFVTLDAIVFGIGCEYSKATRREKGMAS